MKLTGQEINALTFQISSELLRKVNAVNSKIDKQNKELYFKTREGKLYLKLPEWMRKHLEDYLEDSDSFKAVAKSTYSHFGTKRINSDIVLNMKRYGDVSSLRIGLMIEYEKELKTDQK